MQNNRSFRSADAIFINESREFQLIVHCKGIANAYETDTKHFKFSHKKHFSQVEVDRVRDEVKLLNEYLIENMPHVNYLQYGLLCCCCTCCLSMVPFFVKSSGVSEQKLFKKIH